MANKALIKNGKIVVIDRAGVKTIPTVAGDVKSIEVTLTENVTELTIDLASMINVTRLEVFAYYDIIDSVNLLPSDGRILIQLNNIISGYRWATLNTIGFQPEPTSGQKIVYKCLIETHKTSAFFLSSSIRVTNAGTQSVLGAYPCVLDAVIDNITLIKFKIVGAGYMIKSGSKFIITKLD